MAAQHTTVLIVGAGPTGLAAALSLVKNGFRDFIIVDAVQTKGPASRAISIHPATLEALATIDCVKVLIERGIKSWGMAMWDRTGPLIQTHTSALAPYTPYPYTLLISQDTTEKILEENLRELGISVLRPERAVSLESVDNGDLEVLFESGKIITARYVVGADGARSLIREMAGVGFRDPDGAAPDESVTQMVLADITFSRDTPHLPKDYVIAVTSAKNFFIVIPLPQEPGSTEDVYRVGFTVSHDSGPAPSNPSLEFIQRHVDAAGPLSLSSNPAENPDPIYVSRVVWASRFRIRSAIADTFIVRMGGEGTGIVLLVGDAAHIHSPAGGQGMNLGIRDAVLLGPMLAAHATTTITTSTAGQDFLSEYARTRRERALKTIQLTKRISAVRRAASRTTLLKMLLFFLLRLLMRIPWVQRQIVWNMSGLGNR